MKDAGFSCIPQKKQDIGIVGASDSGSMQSDIDYFKDYLDCGRTLSRGNLFIYTLPSSPLGEAAIHFGLQGPLLYAASAENPLMTALTILIWSFQKHLQFCRNDWEKYYLCS
jgi:3-oxoacyl-[acyl-carrier-protein] synthase II